MNAILINLQGQGQEEKVRPQRRGGGGGGGAGLKNFFSALRASVWSKNKREAGLPGPLPPDPPLHWLVRIV